MNNRARVLNATREKIAAIYAAFPAAEELAREDVRRVTVLLGSSRCGSSFLFSLLAESGRFWTPQGEETPFYRLADLGWVDSLHDSDVLCGPCAPKTLDSAARELLRDLGQPGPASPFYPAQAATRLLMQWPTFALEPESVLASFRYWLERSPTPEALWNHWLDSAGLPLGLYDFQYPQAGVAPDVPDLVVEEPPFVIQKPRRAPTRAELSAQPVLLKTSSHAYRIPWLRALFPAARFQWIVLTRHPAASLNGLIDGWLSPSFHSHNLRGIRRLQIGGYSKLRPGGEIWWKFDLPPGWNDRVREPLERICAFQWTSAYEHILRETESSGDPVLRVQYEKLSDPTARAGELARILTFAGVDGRPAESRDSKPVMATEPPSPTRWRKREREILPLLRDPALIAVAEKLQYDLSSPA